VHAAQLHGAEVVLGSAVASLRIAGGRVQGVVSSAGYLPASIVVLAAGTDVPALCEPLGVRLPVAASPGFLLHVQGPPGLVRTVLATPRFEVREVRDGSLLMTAPVSGDLSGSTLRRLAQHTLDGLRSTLRSHGPLRLLGYRLSRRPMPPHGPIVGYLGSGTSVYVAVMHSGVTLAPTVGRLVAQELVGGRPAAELRRCRPRDLPL
jgi:glycine/D-amino acid oxidase-like deaminating enzyme